MKKGLLLALSIVLLFVVVIFKKKVEPTKPSVENFTNVTILNSSVEDSVKVYVTLQAANSVVGLFGITDTIGSCSKGYFYAKKDSSYKSDRSTPLLGAVVSFKCDNVPCQVAVERGFHQGINIFEFSINVANECFDISCVDGVNAEIKVSVNDTNWTTGLDSYIQKFDSATCNLMLDKNIGIRGVYSYRCTDCIGQGSSVPENCFGLRDTCNVGRFCQVNRVNHIGGNINCEYKGSIRICQPK